MALCEKIVFGQRISDYFILVFISFLCMYLRIHMHMIKLKLMYWSLFMRKK